MRRLWLAFLFSCLAFTAQAQTTKSGLISEVNTNLPDNTTGQITPAVVRTTLIDMINSWLDLNGTAGFNCGVNTWVNAFTNLSTPSCQQLAFSNLSGNIAIAQIAGGTGASNTTFLRGDNTWVTPAGAGTLTGYSNTAGTGMTTSGTCSISSGNNLASPCQYGLSAARQTLPTVSLVTRTSHSGGFGANGSGTYTTPANVLWIEIWLYGAGSGGGGGNNSSTTSVVGGSTCWNTAGAACTSPVYAANGGGVAAAGNSVGTGGTTSGACTFAVAGGTGTAGSESISGTAAGAGGSGGNGTLGGGGAGLTTAVNGLAGTANTGAGGGGGGMGTGGTAFPGAGGGAGGTCYVLINSPAVTYTYAVGASGAGAAAGSGGGAGGAGADGQIRVIEHYGS